MSETIGTHELVDIRTVKVDPKWPKPVKLAEHVRQIKDPYHYRCGVFTIHEIHPQIGPYIEKCLEGMES